MMVPKEEAEQEIICEGIRRILYQYRGHIEEKDMDEVLNLVNLQSTKILEQQKELDLLHKLNKMQSDRDKQDYDEPTFRMFRD